MDRISDSNGIIWLFLGIMLYCLLTVIFTFGVWAKSEKVSKFFYSADFIVTVIILFCDMEIVFFFCSIRACFTTFFGVWKSIYHNGRCYALCKCFISKKE